MKKNKLIRITTLKRWLIKEIDINTKDLIEILLGSYNNMSD